MPGQYWLVSFNQIRMYQTRSQVVRPTNLIEGNIYVVDVKGKAAAEISARSRNQMNTSE